MSRQQAVRLFPSSSSLLSNKTMSHKTFHYRLYPTKKQETTLTSWLKLLCETYNAALQERRDAYRLAGKSIGFSRQCAELPACREVRPDLASVPSQVLQDAVKRYGNSFSVESGKKNRGTLKLAKLGQVKMVMHRPLQGTPKSAIVKRTPT
ncbi:MAG TPA: helix-turn-helix domain-containing protein, partial [Ktedonobacteraceae bacterium]|nr:helix-turn-helix domain-containing protein [Ktedonobacteraceae bacterium]